jgi:hypothetical protein
LPLNGHNGAAWAELAGLEQELAVEAHRSQTVADRSFESERPAGTPVRSVATVAAVPGERKPLTDKQRAALEQGRAKRAENLEAKRADSNRRARAEALDHPEPAATDPPAPPRRRSQPAPERSSSERSERGGGGFLASLKEGLGI